MRGRGSGIKKKNLSLDVCVVSVLRVMIIVVSFLYT